MASSNRPRLKESLPLAEQGLGFFRPVLVEKAGRSPGRRRSGLSLFADQGPISLGDRVEDLVDLILVLGREVAAEEVGVEFPGQLEIRSFDLRPRSRGEGLRGSDGSRGRALFLQLEQRPQAGLRAPARRGLRLRRGRFGRRPDRSVAKTRSSRGSTRGRTIVQVSPESVVEESARLAAVFDPSIWSRRFFSPGVRSWRFCGSPWPRGSWPRGTP